MENCAVQVSTMKCICAVQASIHTISSQPKSLCRPSWHHEVYDVQGSITKDYAVKVALWFSAKWLGLVQKTPKQAKGARMPTPDMKVALS